MDQNKLFIVGKSWDTDSVFIEDISGRFHVIEPGREYRPEKYTAAVSTGKFSVYGFSHCSVGHWRKDESGQLFIDVTDSISGKVLSFPTPLTEPQLNRLASDSRAITFTKAAVRSLNEAAIQSLRDAGYIVISPVTYVPLL
jgi:hypothetical protein